MLLAAFLEAGQTDAVTLNPGDILVADYRAKSIIRVDPSSGAQTIVSMGGALRGPPAIVVDASGQLLVVDQLLPGVVRIDPADGRQTVVSAGNLLMVPQGIAIAPTGDLFVTHSGSNQRF